jgi:hypothetical protein
VVTKKRTKRKTKTKSKGTKKSGTKETLSRRTKGKDSRAKRGGVKKKVAKKTVRKKPTKKERRAKHPTHRKQETNKADIRDYFEMEDRKWTPALSRELKMVFLRAFARHGIISDGTLAAGITYRTFYRWRKEDETFNEDCKTAVTMANDLMEREARRRGVEGFERPIIYQGEITGEYTDYSDALLTTLMKGNKPEKYKERTQLSGSVGRPMTLDEETKEDVVSSILGMIKNKPDPKGGA